SQKGGCARASPAVDPGHDMSAILHARRAFVALLEEDEITLLNVVAFGIDPVSGRVDDLRRLELARVEETANAVSDIPEDRAKFVAVERHFSKVPLLRERRRSLRRCDLDYHDF